MAHSNHKSDRMKALSVIDHFEFYEVLYRQPVLTYLIIVSHCFSCILFDTNGQQVPQNMVSEVGETLEIILKEVQF